MPVMDGIAATAEIKRRWPDVEVVALTELHRGGAGHRRARGGRDGLPAQGRRRRRRRGRGPPRPGRRGPPRPAGRAPARRTGSAAGATASPAARAAHRPRARGPRARRQGPLEQGDRRAARHHRADGADPRLEHPRQARPRQPHPGGPLGDRAQASADRGGAVARPRGRRAHDGRPTRPRPRRALDRRRRRARRPADRVRPRHPADARPVAAPAAPAVATVPLRRDRPAGARRRGPASRSRSPAASDAVIAAIDAEAAVRAARSSSASRSAGTSRSSRRGCTRTGSRASCSRAARRSPSGPSAAPFRVLAVRMERLPPRDARGSRTARFFRPRYRRPIAGPIIEGGFWSSRRREALRRCSAAATSSAWPAVDAGHVVNGALRPRVRARRRPVGPRPAGAATSSSGGRCTCRTSTGRRPSRGSSPRPRRTRSPGQPRPDARSALRAGPSRGRRKGRRGPAGILGADPSPAREV